MVANNQGYRAWRASHPTQSVEQYIEIALTRGDIQAYPLSNLSELENTKQHRQFTKFDGSKIQLVPASYLLTDSLAKVESITNQVDAVNAMGDFPLTEFQQHELEQAFNCT